MLNTLKFKFIIASLLLISTIMSLSTWRDINDTKQRLIEGQKVKAGLMSQSVIHSISILMLKNRWKDLQSMIENIARDATDINELRIFLPDNGQIVSTSKSHERGNRIFAENMKGYSRKIWREAVVLEKKGERYVSKLTPIQNKAECQKCHEQSKTVLGVLDLELSLSGIDESIRSSVKKHVEDALIVFLIMGGGILLVVGLLIDRPIRNMINTIKKIERGDLSVRMDEGPNEFGIMAGSFNSMLDSVEASNREVERCHTEQMQRAAKLASLGEIMSGIAHEIKNPLAGISCAVQVFQSELEDGDSRKVVAAEILDNIKRLDNIVKSLLNYARPKSPRLMNMKVTDVLDKAVFFVYPEARKHNVTIDTSIEKEIPEIMMDLDQMQQVFLNLMINAVQAMPDGGHLKIIASESDKDTMAMDDKERSLLRAERLVTVKFEDNGHGIDPEAQKSIFDPFITKKSQGTGLGLSISQRIVQEHGGDIIVNSEVDKGTTFTVYLPEISNS